MKTIPRTCTNCQVEFLADPREVNRGNAKFCSRSCSARFNSKRKPQHVPNSHCYQCGAELYRKPGRLAKSNSGVFFCDRWCQAAAAKDPFSEYAVGPTRVGDKINPGWCNLCGRKHGSIAYSTCLQCREQQKINAWLSGDNSASLNGGVNRETKTFVKRYLIETRGDKCEVCGFDEKAPDGRSIIQMDHINGNCHDNRPENLQLLCPNHHAMTPTYGSKNRGSGRAHRRKAGASES